MRVKRHDVIDLGITLDIPMVPLDLTLNVNGEWIEQVDVSWGDDTVVHEVPKGVLMALYGAVDGDDEELVPGGLLGDHYVVQSVIVARSWKVALQSTREIGADLKAKAQAKASAGAEVSFDFSGDKRLTVEVDGDVPYVIAVSGVRWKELRG
jgi:hypothetical protein